jgi:hypothetical protein
VEQTGDRLYLNVLSKKTQIDQFSRKREKSYI